MNRTAAVVAAALAASSAHANPGGTWSWEWVHVEPGTTNEITPKMPGVVSPGEAVEFRGSFQFTGMGAMVMNHQGVEGPIVGFAHSFLNFVAAPNHGGSFYLPVDRHPIPPGGDPVVEPDQVRLISLGQIVSPGQPLTHTGSTFPNALVIRWDPVTYDERLVDFEPYPLLSHNRPTGANLYILRDPVGLDYAQYHLPMSSWGSVQVPIIPSPSALALMSLAGVMALRRRRC